MRRSYLETFFRHPLVLSLPVILALVVALGYGLQSPRTYLANAALWADTRVPADSTIGTTGGSETPAAGQQALLSELLTTRAFLLAVAEKSPVGSEIRGRSPLEVDGALARMAAGISVATAGPHVVRIAVLQRTPELATGVTNTLLTQFLIEQGARLSARAEAQARYDKRQLEAATRTLNNSKSGGTSLSSSSAGSALVQQYADAAKAYAKSSAAVASVDQTALSVAEKPAQAYPQSRRKLIIFAAAGGLMAGGTVSLLALLVLVARDRSARAEADIERLLGLDVVGTVVELPRVRRQLESGSPPEPTAAQGPS